MPIYVYTSVCVCVCMCFSIGWVIHLVYRIHITLSILGQAAVGASAAMAKFVGVGRVYACSCRPVCCVCVYGRSVRCNL